MPTPPATASSIIKGGSPFEGAGVSSGVVVCVEAAGSLLRAAGAWPEGEGRGDALGGAEGWADVLDGAEGWADVLDGAEGWADVLGAAACADAGVTVTCAGALAGWACALPLP